MTEKVYHAAGAAHGTIYFKMLDDAGFYAANTFVSDRFLLYVIQPHFTKPVRSGRSSPRGAGSAGGSGFRCRLRLVDEEDEIGRGTGTFMRSHIPLSSLPGYVAES